MWFSPFNCKVFHCCRISLRLHRDDHGVHYLSLGARAQARGLQSLFFFQDRAQQSVGPALSDRKERKVGRQNMGTNYRVAYSKRLRSGWTKVLPWRDSRPPSGIGNTRKMAMISQPTSILLIRVALKPRVALGLANLHPSAGLHFLPREEPLMESSYLLSFDCTSFFPARGRQNHLLLLYI